jgi:hypothetical protein
MSNWADTVLSPLKTAGGMVEKLVDIRDTVKFGEATVKLQAQIMSAYQGAFAMKDRETALNEEIRQLKEEVTSLKTWDAEKQRYELVGLAPNVLAYAVKQGMRGTEPPHYICANCYANGKKSFMQQHVHGSKLDMYKCNSCGENLKVNKPSSPQRYTPNPGSGWSG